MATMEVSCPVCKGNHVQKYGKSPEGEQRYQCMNKECPKRIFRMNYRYRGNEPGIDEKIIAMAANASGIRDTARVLRISTDKVMDTLKKRNHS